MPKHYLQKRYLDGTPMGPEVTVIANDPNKDYNEEEVSWIRLQPDKDKARSSVDYYRLNKPLNRSYTTWDRWNASIDNETNPLVGLNKTVGRALTGASAATTLPYLLSRGASAIIPNGKLLLQGVRLFTSKNYLNGVKYGNYADIGQIIQNPTDPTNYIEFLTGRLTSKMANTGLGVGSSKWAGAASADAVANLSGMKQGGKFKYI